VASASAVEQETVISLLQTATQEDQVPVLTGDKDSPLPRPPYKYYDDYKDLGDGSSKEVYSIDNCNGKKTKFHIGTMNWRTHFDLRRIGQGVTTIQDCWAAAAADSKCMGMIDDAVNNPDDPDMTTALAFSPWLAFDTGPGGGSHHSACMCGRFDHSQSLSEDQMDTNTGVSWNCILAGRDFNEVKIDDYALCLQQKKQNYTDLKKQLKDLKKQVKEAKWAYKAVAEDLDEGLESCGLESAPR